MSANEIGTIIDLATFPIAQPDSAGYRALLSRVRSDLSRDGCSVLRNFVHADGVTRLTAEAEATAPNGHRSFNRTNAYFTQDDPQLSQDHPARRFYDRSNSFVPADNFNAGSALRSIYEWPAFPAFIKAALDEEKFYPYADPLADVIVNVVEEGDGFPWHFDTNNYTVTLAIQNGDEGGAFEYAPNIRTATEENFEAVSDILDGKSEKVRTLELQPGDLQIFKGRYSLHRVAPVKGVNKRYVAIFSFVEEPGMVGSPERTRQLYGRVLPIHLERAGQRGDALID